jgi:hypothetical protein
MARKKAEPPPEPEKPKEEDPFMIKIQAAIEGLLATSDGKELNAVITNAIRFLVAKNKIIGDEDDGSFFGD